MADNSDLLKRLEQLEAIEAIKQLKARYWFACDQRDVEGIRQCFKPGEILIDFGFIGRFTNIDDFIGIFEQLACHADQIDMHHGTCPEITLLSDSSAAGRWRMRFQLLETEKKLVQLMHGYYEDEYIKVDGEWKIKSTTHHLLSNLLLQAEQGPLELLDIGAKPGLVTQQ